jgi:anaerobic magnesium-protoporphyrin IX monomethyl ester cyclase
MKQAGCYMVAFGVDSADQGILDAARKHESVETIRAAIRMAEEEGILTLGHFVLGLPGETAKSMEETIRFARESRLSRAFFHILDVLPGSELWSTLSGQFAPDWDKGSYREPEWIPPGLSKREIMKAQSRALRSFYFRPKQLLWLLELLFSTDWRTLPLRLKNSRIFWE